MGIALSSDARALIDRPNFAHLATIIPDRSPQSAPVWVARDGDLILIATEEGSLKGKNTRRDPRVSLSIVDFHDPYRELQIRGRVVERRPDPKLEFYDAISRKYIGKSWPYRDTEGPIVLAIEVLKARYSKQPFEHTPPARP
jgi:PPOX class probable F420-dependent enzyme